MVWMDVVSEAGSTVLVGGHCWGRQTWNRTPRFPRTSTSTGFARTGSKVSSFQTTGGEKTHITTMVYAPACKCRLPNGGGCGCGGGASRHWSSSSVESA